ncbi:helix-turn-helix domain-containing protein [Luteococcus peritonei]|uniref:Helix-turn-helix domain-containing protein n=1 Tax=Luteococcus peritonei TaxID=88874 RepID=A0ABW4RUR3_9ACTN
MGISRACASKWVNRHRDLGDPGLLDGSSAPHTSPTRTPDNVIEEALKLRRAKKWSAAKISTELAEKHGLRVSTSTIQRHLRLHNLHRRRFLDLDGEPVREPQKITARPGRVQHHPTPRGLGLEPALTGPPRPADPIVPNFPEPEILPTT